jgi:ribosomal protein S12 methylthiotransferase accessory factor YcaO
LSELLRLQREWPLGLGWSAPEEVSDTISVAGLRLARVGLASHLPGARTITGSAADMGESPTPRAYFELLERAGTVEAAEGGGDVSLIDPGTGMPRGRVEASDLFPASERPGDWVYSLSNGVAFHTDLRMACDRALWELVERDRLLRAWYGQLRVERTELPPGSALEALAPEYGMEAYLVPAEDPRGFLADVRVAMVVGFPKRAGVPLMHGFGARPRAADALAAATREALQALAFVWEEDVPSERPDMAPLPQTHLDWYLHPPHHALLRRWLDGGHARYAVDWSMPAVSGPPAYADITPPWLRGRAWVIKALAPHAVPLTFGWGPDRLSSHLPELTRIHPIA